MVTFLELLVVLEFNIVCSARPNLDLFEQMWYYSR